MRIMKDHKYEPEKPMALCKCICGNEMVCIEKLEKFDPEDEQEYEICFVSAYLGNQRSKLRALWNLLRGKETYYSSALIPESDFKKLLAEAIKLTE